MTAPTKEGVMEGDESGSEGIVPVHEIKTLRPDVHQRTTVYHQTDYKSATIAMGEFYR